MLFVVKYTGPFGFIKPWTAVRDVETYSQQFLTPSIVEGIEKKLFPELLEQVCVIQNIVRHRLNYASVTMQKEKTWAKGGFQAEKKKDALERIYYKAANMGVLTRGILLEPNLYLAFNTEGYAQRAFTQSICLCRNEDILMPESCFEINEADFDEIQGFELHFSDVATGFKVGHNRFDGGSEMFGELKIYGSNPIREK